MSTIKKVFPLFVLFTLLAACSAPVAPPSINVNQQVYVEAAQPAAPAQVIVAQPAPVEPVVNKPTVEPEKVASGEGNVVGSAENAVSFAQATTCESWTPGETKALKPGQTIMGDVVFIGSDGTKMALYKSDIGGYEAASNVGATDLKFFSEWGAGCLETTDTKTIVNGELANPNHTDFQYAHHFVFASEKSYTEKIYKQADLPIK